MNAQQTRLLKKLLTALVTLIGGILAAWLGLSPEPEKPPPRAKPSSSQPSTVGIKRGGSFSGQVVSVSDGDTMTVQDGQEQRRVRLANIDSPESKQEFGPEARVTLANLCFGKKAAIEVQDIDRYQRVVGVVTCNRTEANTEQVRQGLAWVYEDYNKDPDLPALQQEAKRQKRGLWAKRNPTPPWEWRREKREGRD